MTRQIFTKKQNSIAFVSLKDNKLFLSWVSKRRQMNAFHREKMPQMMRIPVKEYFRNGMLGLDHTCSRSLGKWSLKRLWTWTWNLDSAHFAQGDLLNTSVQQPVPNCRDRWYNFVESRLLTFAIWARLCLINVAYLLAAVRNMIFWCKIEDVLMWERDKKTKVVFWI